ncbi:YbaB/EbfC family nucleoid-associated protein [Pedobacter chitinilyticus]|jgi:DNA-binding protein YbaB|uniref:YbaB/EbfC family DNA-binding protein n=1 Tax=Pedobacter chitinilyticus TaxID=2233776 RepID=A0A443YUP1_9SPHI|nr:YbaB/EbfC family nucleoid-associated protein [Pedobacter chitinilyticus]RWU07542.1 YbaB/EbfC family DNA-binding protein [Pedobacter chitinilyticus]
MFDKLMAAQGKAEEIKKRLDGISVFGEVEGGAIKVTATANKAITGISISDEFYEQADKEELEELLQAAVNKALAQADQVSAAEMQAATKEMLGGFGGLFGQ